MNQRKFSRIAYRLFRARTRTAKFELNYDDVRKDEKGIYVGLDGHLDFKSIEDSFLEEEDNIEKLADEFSKTLLNNKNNVEQLKDIDVTNIDKKNYKILHDEHKNELYLFLPVDAYNSTAKEKRDKATEKEQSGRTKGIIGKILQAMREFMKRDPLEESIEDEDQTLVQLITVSKDAEDTIDGYDVGLKLERVVGKRNDQIESRLYMTLKYDGEMIYNKGFQKTYRYKDYDLVASNRDNDGSIFDIEDNGDDIEKLEENIENLLNDCEKGDEEIIKAFRKDLTTQKIIDEESEGFNTRTDSTAPEEM